MVVSNLSSFQLNPFLIIRLTIKRRVDIHQVDLSAKFLEQVAHHLEVVAPKYFVEPAVGVGAVYFFELGGVVLGGGEGAFAFPVEHGVALDGVEGVFFDVWERLGEVEGFLVTHGLFFSCYASIIIFPFNTWLKPIYGIVRDYNNTAYHSCHIVSLISQYGLYQSLFVQFCAPLCQKKQWYHQYGSDLF